MRRRLEGAILKQWYAAKPTWGLALSPFSLLFKGVTTWRYQRHLKQRQKPSVPLLVVGNITVGGTGKTPLVIALCQAFIGQGIKPIVISRGYGSAAPHYPYVINQQSSVQQAGDEPFLIYKRAGVPVIIDADRQAAAQKALTFEPDIIISDDGLQHYGLARTAEIVVIDGERGLGNGWCLPTGPLRESATRLEQVNHIVINGGNIELPNAVRMQLKPSQAVNLLTGKTLPLLELAQQGEFNAIAGIGNPERFFTALELQGLTIERHVFADHHAYGEADLNFDNGHAIIMTEKDSVKCANFATDKMWFLPVDAVLPDGFVDDLLNSLLLKSE